MGVRRVKDCRKYIYNTHVMQNFPLSLGIIHYLFFCFMIFSVFRLRLFIERYEDIKNLSLLQHLKIFWVGFRLDGVVIGYTSVLLVIYFLIFSQTQRKIAHVGCNYIHIPLLPDIHCCRDL